MPHVTTILSGLSGRQVELFYVLLVSAGRYTFLPEIYDVFGKEQTVKFLELFAGVTIKIPDTNVLQRYAEDISIYYRIEKAATTEKKRLIVDQLGIDLDLDRGQVLRRYKITKRYLEAELGFKVE
jgi:hypothetical protein